MARACVCIRVCESVCSRVSVYVFRRPDSSPFLLFAAMIKNDEEDEG